MMHQEHGGGDRVGDRIVRKVCSSSSPTMPTGMVRQDQQPGQPLFGVRDSRRAMLVTRPRTMRTQSRQKNTMQRERRGDVQPDDEGEVGRLGRGDVEVLGPAAADDGRAAARCAPGWRPGTARRRPAWRRSRWPRASSTGARRGLLERGRARTHARAGRPHRRPARGHDAAIVFGSRVTTMRTARRGRRRAATLIDHTSSTAHDRPMATTSTRAPSGLAFRRRR